MIDVDRDSNGKQVNERLKGKRNGGLPWMVILAGAGKELVSSSAEPDGNNLVTSLSLGLALSSPIE